MTIGQIKSGVEKILLESYSNNTFANEIKVFKKLVLENKNISKKSIFVSIYINIYNFWCYT